MNGVDLLWIRIMYLLSNIIVLENQQGPFLSNSMVTQLILNSSC